MAHTVALPDPTEVMDARFVASLDALDTWDTERLTHLIEEAEERLFATNLSDLSRSADFVGAPPPRGLLSGAVSTAVDVAAAIERVALRWRLDAILALQDHID